MDERTRSASKNDELQLLDCLGTDFVYLRRFILATQQMVRILGTELARGDFDVQEKMISAMEIARETLGEVGVSARPFVPCPANLLLHREAYFEMLNVARGLVPYVKDAEVRLRLRRLLLPLSSISRFRVSLHDEEDVVNDPPAELSSSSSDAGQRPTTPVEEESPSKKIKLSTPSSPRCTRGLRATTPSPSTTSAARTDTNTALASQRTRADAISSDVSQRGLVTMATQTVMSKSYPIRESPPPPNLFPTVSLPPSTSPPPSVTSPSPSINLPESYANPNPPPTTPIKVINDPSFIGPCRATEHGTELPTDEELWDWFSGRNKKPGDPIVFGGPWAKLKVVSHEEFMATTVPFKENWILPDIAPKQEKVEEKSEEPNCNVM